MTTEWTDDRNQPQGRVLLDSISPAGVRLTTMEVTIHRFVLAELNTHRVFSRNSASSRAIPFTKQVEKVLEHPAIPVEWRARQSGMQGGDLLPWVNEDAKGPGEGWGPARMSELHWLRARDMAVKYARMLHEEGVHKSIVNRILEPFLWHNVIITATEWDGFWAQRCSPLAQPEIRVAAESMKSAYDNSTPRELGSDDWHTPLIQPHEENDGWHDERRRLWDEGHRIAQNDLTLRKAVSAARCARVSYLTHDGERDLIKDLELFDRLASADPPHASPFEHVATPHFDQTIYSDQSHAGNLRGWTQMRHEFWPSAYVTTGATT